MLLSNHTNFGLLGAMAQEVEYDCNNAETVNSYIKEAKVFNSLLVISSKEMLDKECRTLKRSLDYFDGYADKCYKDITKQHFRTLMDGVREFISQFCEKADFSKDLLMHKECFKKITTEMNVCNKTFHAEAVKPEVMCSARTHYVLCARKLGESHCEKEDAIAVCKLANILASLIVPKEKCIDQDSLCASSGTTLQTSTAVLLAGIVLMFKNL